MEVASIVILASSVLTIIVALFSKKYYSLKGRIKALAELLQTTSKALEDDQITQEELQKIMDLVNRSLGKE